MNRPQFAKRKESPFRGSFFGDLTPGGTSVIIRGTGTPWVTGRVAQARAVVSGFRGMTWLTLQQLTD
jgi:hypothetical protein